MRIITGGLQYNISTTEVSTSIACRLKHNGLNSHTTSHRALCLGIPRYKQHIQLKNIFWYFLLIAEFHICVVNMRSLKALIL